MSNSSILTAFNNHFIEFIDDMQVVFPNDPDILLAKNSILAIKKANPKIMISIWMNYLVSKYKNEIEAGNIDFFINKNYMEDISNAENSKKIIESIDRLRSPIKNMSKENQEKSMKYIQNLSKMAFIYESQK